MGRRRRGGEEESKAYACLPIQASLSSLDMAYPSGTRLGRQVPSRPPLGYAMSALYSDISIFYFIGYLKAS